MADRDTDDDLIDKMLDEHFGMEHSREAPISAGLMTRLIDDAAQASVRSAHTAHTARAPGLLDRLRSVFDGVGAWQGASVLTASALFGVMMGYASADGIAELPGFSLLNETLALDIEAEIGTFDSVGFDFDLPEG